MGLAAIRPLKHLYEVTDVKWFRVAVGLAAIRPLKQVQKDLCNEKYLSCSGFGRYQAVETIQDAFLMCRRDAVAVGLAAIRPLKLLSGCHLISGDYVAVGLAAIRPLKRTTCPHPQAARLLQWVWPLSGR